MLRRLAFSVLSVATLLGAATLSGCDSLLDLNPPDELPGDVVIDSAPDARSALLGAYSALGSYYDGSFVFFGDLSADNTTHTGTYTWYAEAGDNAMRSDNAGVAEMWLGLYYAINVANQIIDEVPLLDDLAPAEKNQILGEAYFLRALNHHNLVKLWGDVPIKIEATSSSEETANVTRSPADEVYAQILSDLGEAEGRMTGTQQTSQASLGAARALHARVCLYRQDWACAEQKAAEVEAMGYTLAPDYSALFAPTSDTPEAIFQFDFDAQNYNNFGYYFKVRREVRPTSNLAATYEPEDARAAWSITTDEQGNLVGTKFPTTDGSEDFHVLRFAEVLLTRAEALARLSRLGEAVAEYNRLRVRAGLAPHVLGTDVTTQDDVLGAIWHERRVELAFEGDRWPDLVRTGRAPSVLGISANMTRYPVPQTELDTAPNMTQNPGY